jgi:hypothetical protein
LVIVDAYTGVPFPNNIIPQSKINRLAPRWPMLYPAPQLHDQARNYYGNQGFSDNDIVSADRPSVDAGHPVGRFTMNAPLDQGGVGSLGSLPGFDQVQDDNNLQFALGNVHIPPTVINEVNLGYVQFRQGATLPMPFVRNWIEELGIKGT